MTKVQFILFNLFPHLFLRPLIDATYGEPATENIRSATRGDRRISELT